MLSVYMRPWTLNPANATSPTPLLTNLSQVTQQPDNNGSATPPANILNAVPPRRRRKNSSVDEQTTHSVPTEVMHSYAATWKDYVNGHDQC